MKKMIIDCDPGIDDAIAILLAAKDKNTEIMALTSTFGNTDIDNATSNLLALNKLLNINAPVYRGSEGPLMREKSDFTYFHGSNGMGNVVLSNENLTTNKGYAWDEIYELCKKYPNEITLVTLGPLTNIAKAFLKYENLPSLIKEIIVMGGTAGPGNEGVYGEVNFINDPHAAKIVMNANVKKTMDGLVANDTIGLTHNEMDLVLEKLKVNLPELYEALKFYNNSQIAAKAEVLVINDAAAMFVALEDDYEVEYLPIDVEIYSSTSLGRSIIDRRPYTESSLKSYNVVNIDKEKYLEKLLNSI